MTALFRPVLTVVAIPILRDAARETQSRFDSLAFTAVCTGMQAAPPLDVTLAVLDRELDPRGRDQVVQYLSRLAEGLAPGDPGPGGPDALGRLTRHFEQPSPTTAVA